MRREDKMSFSTDANDNFKQNSREREREESREKIILEEMRREDKMKRAFFEEQMQGPGSDWNDNQRIRDPYMGGDKKGQASGDRDPFSSGINREDPGDMGSYAKAWEQTPPTSAIGPRTVLAVMKIAMMVRTNVSEL